MAQTVDQERNWWNAAASSAETAKEKIAASEAAWSGELLEETIGRILPALGGLAAGARVLDLGCGIGRLAIPIAKRFPKITIIGVDISPSMLRLAAQRSSGITNLKWVLCNGRILPSIGPLHAAFSMITLQHVPRPVALGYIRQVGRQLVSGGVFRFQIYEGRDEVFLCHQVDKSWVKKACKRGGMVVDSYERVRAIGPDQDLCPWVTARKKRALSLFSFYMYLKRAARALR